MLDEIANIKVMKALNGLEAVKLYREDHLKTCCDIRIKLVMMDVDMPLSDGFEATKAIFEVDKEFKVRIVLPACEVSREISYIDEEVIVVGMTAFYERPNLLKVYENRMNTCFLKPVRHHELKKWLTNCYLAPWYNAYGKYEKSNASIDIPLDMDNEI